MDGETGGPTTAATAEQQSSVKLATTAKGTVQIEAKVYAETAEAASIEAVRVLKMTRVRLQQEGLVPA
jgi:hypothetical protein